MKCLRKIAIIPVLASLFASPLALAATIEAGEEYSLPENEIISDDMYVAAGDVVVAGNVDGDLTVAGGNVVVTGDVKGDLNIIGGTLQVLGNVGDDIRAAGGNITIGADVGGDVVSAAGAIQVLPGVTIGGDLIAGAGQLSVMGIIAGDLDAAAGDANIGGNINGNVSIHTADSVKIGKSAVIGGNLFYRSPIEAAIAEGAVITGSTKYAKKERRGGGLAVFTSFWFLGITSILLATALIALYMFPAETTSIVLHANSNFAKELLRGFIVLVVTPFIVFLLAISLIGSLVAIIGFVAYILMLLVAKVYAGIIAGGILARFAEYDGVISWKWAFLGIVVLAIFRLLPLIGAAVNFVFMLAAIGAISHKLYGAFRPAA